MVPYKTREEVADAVFGPFLSIEVLISAVRFPSRTAVCAELSEEAGRALVGIYECTHRAP